MIEGPEAWHGNELAEDSRWRVYLDDNDIAELESALQNVKERGLAWRDMKKASDFPLNRFSEKLVMVSAELEDGCGLVNIKGFPVDRFDDEDINRVWYGISLNLGSPIYQNYCGELLRDIIDEQQDTDAANNNRLRLLVVHSSRAHGQQWSASFPYRSRRCRGVVLRPPGGGGRTSKIASSVRVNNEMVAPARPRGLAI